MGLDFLSLNEAISVRAQSQAAIGYIRGRSSETNVSFAQLYVRARGLLGEFQARGIAPGDELILFIADNEQFIDALWACFLGSIIPVPVAVGISDEHRAKLVRIFEQLQKPHLYIDQRGWDRLQDYADRNLEPTQLKRIDACTIRVAELGIATVAGEIFAAKPDDVALIQFSSGSTRDPKGVVLTHQNILATNQDMGERARYNDQDIALSWMPLTHDLGLIGFHLNMLVFGINHYLIPTELFSRQPLLWLSKASEKRASLLTAPNFAFKHYLKLFEAKGAELDLSCVRIIINGAEPISIALCERFLQALAPMGLKRSAMYPCYGLAEAGLYVSAPILGKNFEYLNLARDHLGVGQQVKRLELNDASGVLYAIEGPPIGGCEIRIMDQHGAALEGGHVGHIQIRGPNVTKGFYCNREADQSITKDGWLDTGDLGFLHLGCLIVTGRAKDIIFVHGQNIYPHDIEAVALEVQPLELGKVVAVAHRPDTAYEDQVLLFVLHRGDLQIFARLAQRLKSHLNQTLGLAISHVLPTKRIPKTTSGKIQRRLLVSEYAAGHYDETIQILAGYYPPDNPSNQGSTVWESRLQQAAEIALNDHHLALDDNLFEVGLTSLQLAQLHEQIDQQFPGKLDISDFFDHPSLLEVAQLLENR